MAVSSRYDVMIIYVMVIGLIPNSQSHVDNVDESDIPELKYLNTTADPCENFYAFTCGNFKEYHPLQANASISDHFSLLEEELLVLASNMLTLPKRTDDPQALKKVKSAYKACMDTSYADNLPVPELQIIEECGGMPLLWTVNQTIAEPPRLPFTWNDVGRMVARYGVPLLFNYELVGQFYSETDFYIYMTQDALTQPSTIRPQHLKTYDERLEEDFVQFGRAMPFNDKSDRSTTTQKPFDLFLETISRRILETINPFKTDDELNEDLTKMSTFMRQLYQGGLVEDDVTIEPLDSFVTLDALQEWTIKQFGGDIGIDWIEYLGNVFSLTGAQITGNVTIMQVIPKVIYGTLNLVRQTDPDVVKNFALLRVFLFLAPDSDNVVRQAFEDYYNAKGYQLYPRWEYCTRKILDAYGSAGLNFALTYDYQLYFFDTNKIAKAAELIRNIEATFKEMLNDSDWMDEQSREAAQRKADNMLVLLAHPDFVTNTTDLDRFYENVRICEWDNYGNAQRIRAFKQAYLFSQIGQPRDRTFWDKSTFDANAYYNRANNKIVFPIAMLNPVFFVGNNTILDYSRVGSIFGHEITHGFDDAGKKYNENGLQIGWWSNETQIEFDTRKNCFIDQYNQYYVDEIDAYVNGTLSLNENIADNGGIRNSFKTFTKLLLDAGNENKKRIASNNKMTRQNSGYTAEQLFFIGYGTMWCVDESVAYLESLNSGSYAPTRYRVNGAVSNMKEFAEAFNCPIGSHMNPEQKCALW